MRLRWITNDVQVAKMLRDADAAYEKDRDAAKDEPLETKIILLRLAKLNRQARYDLATEQQEAIDIVKSQTC